MRADWFDDQKLSSESLCRQLHTAITLLILLTFMIIHLVLFRFEDMVDAKTSVEESPLAALQVEFLHALLRLLCLLRLHCPWPVRRSMTAPTSLASDCSYMSRNMVILDGGIAYNVAARTEDACCKTCSVTQPGTTGGLSIVPVKEIITSQVGPIDQLTGSRLDMLVSSQALWLPYIERLRPLSIHFVWLCGDALHLQRTARREHFHPRRAEKYHQHGLAGITLKGSIDHIGWFTDGSSIFEGPSTSARLGRQECLLRCQGSCTTVLGPWARPWCRQASSRPSLLAVPRLVYSVAPLQVTSHAERDRHIHWVHPSLRKYDPYASTTTLASGSGGWIPAGDNGAHLGARGPRGSRFVAGYLDRAWQVDSCWR